MVEPTRATANPSRGKPRKRNPWLTTLKWLGISLLSLAVIGGVALGVAYATVKIPDPNADFQTNTSFVYYADGKERIGSFQVQNRTSIAYADMNQYAKDAMVAAENRSFWTDPGISIPGLFRAVMSLGNKDEMVGGSTITQQYIKVLYLTQEKSFVRKAKEIILAAKMGQELSKEQILEGYLNTVYFGRGAYGIEAASQAYFGKPQSKLTLAQAVALCDIVNSPGNLDPAEGDKQAADLLERYQYTLNGMVELGTITEAQRSELYPALPKFPKVASDSRFGGPKGFLLKMVENELVAAGFTEDQINGGGLKVVTTFDADAQDAAVSAAQTMTLGASGGNKKAAQNLHAAIASIDNATGGVIALYGGPDFVKSSRNWATTPRPTGSTFKPYALAAALRNGWALTDKVNGNSFTPPGDSTPVHNAGGASYGQVTLLKATTSSINSAYVDLVSQLADGPTQVQQAAVDAGVPENGSWDLSDRIPLGGSEVSPLSQASAYSTFANLGLRVTPHVVAQVTDTQGNKLYTAPVSPTQTIEEDVATDVTYALTKVAEDGTGRRAAQLGYPVAGKTGTAYYSTAGATKTVAAWFVGFTKQITTSVMYVRGDQGNQDLGNSFYGSGYPALTWLTYMQKAMDGLPSEDFAPPTDRTSTKTSTPKPDSNKSDGGSSHNNNNPTKDAQPTQQPTSEPTATSEPTQAPTSEPPATTQPPEEPPATSSAPQPPKATQPAATTGP